MGALTQWIKPAQEKTSNRAKSPQAVIEKREREHNRISPKAEMRDAILIVPDEDVEIHGRWVGENARIHCHTLNVQKGAYVEGDIQAQRIRVFGHIKGEVQTTYLVVQEGATLEGSVKCQSMNAENNSRIRAHIMCDSDEQFTTNLKMPGNDILEERTPRLVSAIRVR